MTDALLIQTALRNLRRKFASDITGLTSFADSLATQSQANPVTLNHTNLDGGSGGGQVTMQSEIWLLAAEELLADPIFNPAAPAPPRRVILPDYRFSTAV